MEMPKDITLGWLALLFATMWPGLLSLVTYRTRVPGPALAWKDSFVVAAFFTTVNYILLFPAARVVMRGASTASPTAFWLNAVLVFLIGPVVLPIAWSWLRSTAWMTRLLVAQYATAWDYYFVRRTPVFALIHLKDGSIVGGYWGPGGYASLSPHAGDLYLTHVYKVEPDGRLGERVQDSDGLLVSRGEYTHIEFVKEPASEAA